MTSRPFFLLLVPLFFLCGCSPVHINYDYDPHIDFSRYSSYDFDETIAVNDDLAVNPLRKQRIVLAVDKSMKHRGFRKVPQQNADFLISIHSTIKEKRELSSVSFGVLGGYDPWLGSYQRPIDVSFYEEETVIVDFRDRISQKVIWSGIGKGIPFALNRKNKIRVQQEINQAIEQLLNNFPPATN